MEPESILSSERQGEVHQGEVNERLKAASCAEVKGGQVTAEPSEFIDAFGWVNSLG